MNVIYRGQKFFALKKGEEKTVEFPAGIRKVQILATLDPDAHIRINTVQKAAEDEYSYMFDSSLYDFSINEDVAFRELSMIANVDVTVQLINPRSCD